MHLNGAGVVQGGAVFTLADLAFAVACNSHGALALAVDVTISFLRPSRTGSLVAEAFEVARTRRLSRCEVKVVDDADEPVALFHGTAFVKDEPLEEVAAPPRRKRARRRKSRRCARSGERRSRRFSSSSAATSERIEPSSAR